MEESCGPYSVLNEADALALQRARHSAGPNSMGDRRLFIRACKAQWRSTLWGHTHGCSSLTFALGV